MRSLFSLLLAGLLVATTPNPFAHADEVAAKPVATADSDMEPTVAALAERVRKSAVVVSFSGRDGKQQGLGTGFVV